MPENTSSTKRQVDSHRATIELKLAEAEALFESIGEGVIVTDVNGKVSRINRRGLEILGVSVEELLGKWFPSVVIAEDVEGHVIPNNKRPIFEAFVKGEAISRRLYYLRKDGSRIPLSITVSPVLLNERPIGAIEVFRDITEELKLERSKDEFIALASHQLRTPATGVKQYTAMLLDGYAGELSDAQFKMLQKVYESNERQINTINDLLRVAQVDAGRVELMMAEVNLSSLLQDIVSEQMHKFQARAQKLHLDIPKTPAWAMIDEDRFRMALENLIDNASKYTPEKRNIYVKIEKLKSRIVIEIKDEGVGIPHADRQYIFEKFSRLENPLSVMVGGTGLGLYWVQKIIDLHRAKISVRSKVNEGTSFIISLPS